MIHQFEKRVFWFIAAICWITLMVALSSCYTEKKATKQVVRAKATYPGMVAALFGEWYEPIVERHDSVIYKPGKPIVKTRTIKGDCDTVTIKEDGTRTIYLPCDCEYTVDTIERYQREVKVNAAKVSALQYEINDQRERYQDKLDKSQTSYDREKARNTIFLWWAIIATVGCIGMAVLKLAKIF